MLSYKNIAVTTLAILVSIVPAFAGQTGWISGHDWRRKVDELSAKGLLPTKFECRDTLKPGFDMGAGEVRVTYTENVYDIAWYWYATSNITTANEELKAKGYHPVSIGTFFRKKSGLKVYCALYYKD